MTSTLTTAVVRGTVGSALLIVTAGVATAQHGAGHSGGMGGGMDGYGLWPLIWLLFLLSVLLVGFAIYSRDGTQDTERTETDPALSTLRSRYARGEISEEEFEERRHRLDE